MASCVNAHTLWNTLFSSVRSVENIDKLKTYLYNLASWSRNPSVDNRNAY